MKKYMMILGVLFAAQVVLSIVMHNSEPSVDTYKAESLLSLSHSDIDEVSIKSNDTQLTLKQSNGAWVMPGNSDLPVASSKIDNVLESLLALQRGWAVSKSEDAAQRFEVDSSNFQKSISFFNKGKELQTVYLGTSPALRQTHLRLEGESDIYALNFSSHQVSTKADDWLDKNLLKMDKNKLESLSVSGLTLVNKDGAWIPGDLKSDEEPVKDEIDKFVQDLSNLTALSLTDAVEESKEVSSTLIFNLDGEKKQYDFYIDDVQAVVKASDHPNWFKVSKYHADRVKNLQRSDIVSPIPTPTPKVEIISDAISDEIVSDEIATDEIATDEIATDEIATDEIVKDEIVKDEIVKDEIVKDEIVKDEIVKDEIVKDEIVKDEIVKDEITLENKPEDLSQQQKETEKELAN